MAENYWSDVLGRRINRRRALAATGASAAAAAFLAACGGGGETKRGPRDLSGLVSPIEDTSKEAKAGGVFRWWNGAEPNHLDGLAQGQAQLNIFNGMVYSSLVRNKPGYKEPSTNTEVLPEMAESWEFSPDRTQLTFKLRRGVKWQNKAPVNGRAFDSSDVVATFQRYKSLPANNRAANVNEFNPNAPIMSVTAPDAYTVVVKLKEPTSYIMQRYANMVTGELGTIQPREAFEGTFNPRQEQIGTGGYILEKWEPSVGFTYKRNPDYWNKEEPRIGTLEVPIIPQYATGLAAFKSGQIYTFAVRAEDQVVTKREVPSIKLYVNTPSAASVGHTIGFGWLPFGTFQRSPFLDARVRQAFSLGEDRFATIDTMFNVSRFESEGLPVETYLFTSIGNVPNVWLDPRSKEFGPDAKWYTPDENKHDEYVKEAKQLLSAAGYPNGFEYPSHFVLPPLFAPLYQQEAEIRDGFQREIGLKPVPTGLDYNIDYLQRFITQQGKFQGILYRLGAVSSPDPVDYYVWRYWSKAGPTSGAIFTGEGSGDSAGDPKVDELIEKAKAEVDVKRQVSILHDLQRHLAKPQYCISRAGVASGFSMAWPAVGNFLVFQGDSRAINGHFYTTWVDDTKPPITRA